MFLSTAYFALLQDCLSKLATYFPGYYAIKIYFPASHIIDYFFILVALQIVNISAENCRNSEGQKCKNKLRPFIEAVGNFILR